MALEAKKRHKKKYIGVCFLDTNNMDSNRRIGIEQLILESAFQK